MPVTRWTALDTTRVILLSLHALVLASEASAGPRNLKEYCIRGAPSGAPWGWEIQIGAIPVATETGLSVAGTGTTADVRDEFVQSINARSVGAPPYLFAQRTAMLPSACIAGDESFYIAGQDAFDLLVTASGSGTLTLVGPPPTGTVTFNPDIFLVPEPSALLMLASGVAAVGMLGRFRGC